MLSKIYCMKNPHLLVRNLTPGVPGPGSLKPIPQSNSHFGKIFEVGFQGMADEVRESQNPQKSTGSTIVRHTAFELKGCWSGGGDSRSFAVGLNEMIRLVTPDKPAAPLALRWRPTNERDHSFTSSPKAFFQHPMFDRA